MNGNNYYPCDINICTFFNLNSLLALKQSKISEKRKLQMFKRIKARLGMRE